MLFVIAAAVDEDDDDLFAEFDVDLDMDTTTYPKTAETASANKANKDTADQDKNMAEGASDEHTTPHTGQAPC